MHYAFVINVWIKQNWTPRQQNEIILHSLPRGGRPTARSSDIPLNPNAAGGQVPRDEPPTAPAPPSADIDPSPMLQGGVLFGKYRILAELGRGGMGIVYTARQPELDRVVCLKMLIAGPHASREQIERLFREAQSAAKLSHANIVPVHEFGEVRGQYYFTMEFVPGRSLASLIDRKPLPPTVAATIA